MLRSIVSVGIILTTFFSALYLSRAFFSDTATSLGNLFQAGTIQWVIGNTSYYNSSFNTDTSWTPQEFQDGNASFKFFDFDDLKPGDKGEDVISLRVETNDAWACYDIDVTDSGNGDLIEEIEFVFWLDDGDGVLEDGEPIVAQGKGSDIAPYLSGALADSTGGVLGLNQSPMEGEETYYLAKAWCFGELDTNPLAQDTTGPDVRTNSVLCDGQGVGNQSQNDTLMADISFFAIQARNNPDYVCPLPPVFIETVAVDSANINGATSTTSLLDGEEYLFVASGTWKNGNVHTAVDAECRLSVGETEWEFSAPRSLRLQVDEEYVTWGEECASDNVYELIFTGLDNSVWFRIVDGDPPVPSWYNDNEGNLYVDIYHLP